MINKILQNIIGNWKLEIGNSRRRRAGFTLVELLVFMGILSLIGIVFLGMQYILTQSQLTAWNSFLSIDEANKIMSQMVRELRNARAGDNGVYPLELTQDQEIVFYSDYNFDGKVEKIRYRLNGTALEKGITAPTGNPISYPSASEKVSVLTTNVRNLTVPIFYYYNSDWPTDTANNPLPTSLRISDTRLVKIQLFFNTKENEPEKDYVLETDVRIRML